MPLSAGARLGPYEVVAPLGAGGMGEVYRAKDTQLGRQVALKVLSAAFAGDPDRMARFRREAQVLASLNHPNIGAIYGLEENALVLELVEGPTLADRLAEGPISPDESVAIAKQIAEALEYAHDKGVIHRDLKPANVKITPEGTVKVLDFGLAKIADDRANSGDPATSPTLTMRATQAGMILGTAGYMAPEQARGQGVDKRADIWAFGVVLFEMLSGKRVFGGETVGDTLAAVLKTDPDWQALPADTPAGVRRLLRRCLERDRKRRLHDIADGRLELEDAEAAEKPETTRATGARRWLGWVVAVVAIVVGALGWWQATRRTERPLLRLQLDLGPEAALGSGSAGPAAILSPDGSRLVYVSRGADGRLRLSMRRLDELQASVLAGTEEAASPFFSPDGQEVAFAAGGKLKKIPVGGGAPVSLCDAPRFAGGWWGEDGDIIATLDFRVGLARLPSSGGTPQPLTKGGWWPQVLPGGKAVLFTGGTAVLSGMGSRLENPAIEVLSLSSGERRTLLRDGVFGRYLPSGHLVYVQAGSLLAAPMDPARPELTGPGVPVLEEVFFDPHFGGAQVDVSRTGTLIYVPGKQALPNLSVRWLDHTGQTAPLLAKPGNYFWPRLSPDGKSLALSAAGEKNDDIWIYDWQRDTMSRLTFGPNNNRDAVWSPDGKYIAFASGTGSDLNLYWIRSDRAGEPERLLETKNLQIPYSFSPDGKWLAFYERDGSGGGTPTTSPPGDIWVLPIHTEASAGPRPGKPEVFLRTPFNEAQPVFSPDGRWLAYVSDESGVMEVYVRSFPGRGGQRQISSGGGIFPVWSQKGRELFYRTLDNRIMVAAYAATGESLVAERPRVWSETRIADTATLWPNLDLAPDGKRFAVMMAEEGRGREKQPTQVAVLLNFFDELRRRAPPVRRAAARRGL